MGSVFRSRWAPLLNNKTSLLLRCQRGPLVRRRRGVRYCATGSGSRSISTLMPKPSATRRP